MLLAGLTQCCCTHADHAEDPGAAPPSNSSQCLPNGEYDFAPEVASYNAVPATSVEECCDTCKADVFCWAWVFDGVRALCASWMVCVGGLVCATFTRSGCT